MQNLLPPRSPGKVNSSSPSTAVDPVAPSGNFQAGGNLVFAVGSLVLMISSATAIPIVDSTGMGRWSGMTTRGKGDSCLSVITAYRVCRGNITTAPLGSTFHREFLCLHDTVSLHLISTHPLHYLSDYPNPSTSKPEPLHTAHARC